MQQTKPNLVAPNAADRHRARRAIAGRDWSAGALTAGEFAMQAVGRLLLQDIATAATRSRHAAA